jgi:hypothetical protein
MIQDIIHGWYTFIAAEGINFLPSNRFYNIVLYKEYQDACQTCKNLQESKSNSKCKLICLFCKKPA